MRPLERAGDVRVAQRERRGVVRGRLAQVLDVAAERLERLGRDDGRRLEPLEDRRVARARVPLEALELAGDERVALARDALEQPLALARRVVVRVLEIPPQRAKVRRGRRRGPERVEDEVVAPRGLVVGARQLRLDAVELRGHARVARRQRVQRVVRLRHGRRQA